MKRGAGAGKIIGVIIFACNGVYGFNGIECGLVLIVVIGVYN